IHSEAAWIVAFDAHIVDLLQLSRVLIDVEDADRVVKSIRRIDEPAVARHAHLGRKTGTGKFRGQCRDHLLRRQRTVAGRELEKNQCRGLLLQAVEPATVWVEGEMTRPIAWRQCYEWRGIGGQHARRPIQEPDVEPVLSEIGMKY